MIAAIRVRFTPTPPSQMWDDEAFANWLNPAVPFSLAHYWYKSSLTFADLQFQLFPALVMTDPRMALSAADRDINSKSRAALVNGVTAQVTASFNPDWSNIDGMLIWFAQRTDLFGGGAYSVPLPKPEPDFWDFLLGAPEQEYKTLPVAVADYASSFDSTCQELGHAYGLDHPLDKARQEYGDPYDSMAARTYGGSFDSGFRRATDSRLPVGLTVDGLDQQTLVGPYLSAAHLTISPFASPLRAAGMFIDVPPGYATGAASFTLHALDDAIDRFPGQNLPIVAIVPPVRAGGETYYLELRRSSGYDAGLRTAPADTDRPPVAVVIHLYDSVRKRIVYVDAHPLEDNRGDRDYHLFGGGDFTFRVTNIGPDFRSVGLTIGGPQFWRHFGVDLEEPQRTLVGTTNGPWQTAEASPCFMFAVGDYRYHYEYDSLRYRLTANSFGYEQPGYVWTVGGVALDPTLKAASISVSVASPSPTGSVTTTKPVPITYAVESNHLDIACDPRVGNFSLYVEVRSVETSPSVLKNVYEDRTILTSLPFKNVRLKWDDAYTQAQKECEEAVERVNEKHIPMRKVGVPRPDDPFRVRNPDVLVSQLIDVGFDVASAVVDGAVRVRDILFRQLSNRR